MRCAKDSFNVERRGCGSPVRVRVRARHGPRLLRHVSLAAYLEPGGYKVKRKRPRPEDLISIPLTKHAEFYGIALEGLKRARRFQRLHDVRNKRKGLTDADVDYLSQKNSEIELASIVAIVFSALALEAFINYYGTQTLSKSYFENYSDRLDLVSKWLIIPRLSLGKELNPGRRAMNLLRALVHKRNNLVHFKSRTKKISELDWSEDWVNLEDAEQSCESVRTVISEMRKLDKKIETDWSV